MKTLVPSIAASFPGTVTADEPIVFEIKPAFDTAAMPEPAARQVLGHLRPHPGGAVMARCGEWVLVLPPGPQGRVFTVPLPLYAALRSLASCEPESVAARFDRTPLVRT